MDPRLVRLLRQVAAGKASIRDVSRFLARYSWSLSASGDWENEAAVNELEYAVAEIQAAMEPPSSLQEIAKLTLEKLLPTAAPHPAVRFATDAKTDTKTLVLRAA